MRHFTKSLPDTPVVLSNGVRYQFEKFPDGRGYVETDDINLINELLRAIERHVGGVSEINEMQYEQAVKKNENLTVSAPPSPAQPPRRATVNPYQSPPSPRSAVAAVAVNIPELKPGAPLAALRGKWRPKATRINP